MTDDKIDRPGGRESRMRRLGLAIALALLGYPTLSLAADAPPPDKVEGFVVPQARPIPGFDQVQTQSDATKPALVPTPPSDPGSGHITSSEGDKAK